MIFLFIYAEFYDVDVMISTEKSVELDKNFIHFAGHLYFRLVTTSVGKLVERHLNYSQLNFHYRDTQTRHRRLMTLPMETLRVVFGSTM